MKNTVCLTSLLLTSMNLGLESPLM